MTGKRPYRIDPAVASARGRLAGLASAQKATAEERRARASRGGEESARRRREQRAAEIEAQTGAPVDPDTLRTPPKPEPSANALSFYLARVDAAQPDREWASAEERRSAALLLAREDAARAALAQAKRDAE